MYMFSFKNCLLVSVAVLVATMTWMFYNTMVNSSSVVDSGKWVEVVYYADRYDPSLLDRDYSEYWDERSNGIGMLKMSAKLIPSTDSSKDCFFLGYKAEIILNSKALAIKPLPTLDESKGINYNYAIHGEYEISYFFSFLDEDGFNIDNLIHTYDKETTRSFSSGFYKLKPCGASQKEQAVITSKEISPQVASRIKKVRVKAYVTKLTPLNI